MNYSKFAQQNTQNLHNELLKKCTMSLYESGDSTVDVSLSDLFNDKVENKILNKVVLKILVKLIVRGGLPEAINVNINGTMKLARSFTKDLMEFMFCLLLP